MTNSETVESRPKSTRQKLVKIPNYPGLYRHVVTGRYYAMKKVANKRREHSLDTADRKIAERRLAEWFRSLTKIDREVERTTLRELIERFVKVNAGRSDKTRATNASVIACFTKTWPYGQNIEVRQIRPSHLDEWLAQHERRLKNTTYNRYAGFLKQMLEIAVKDRIIVESPFDGVKTRWKRPQKPMRLVPTVEQFEAIVACIRSQPYTDHSEDSADFIEFLGLAGLGQAEASSLTWADVDWDNERIHIRRHKTDTRFTIPIYAHLCPLLERLQATAACAQPSTRVLKIKDAKKALKTACTTLKLPPFTQRNIRQCLIRRLWQAGVDRKLIAKWQGHQDGGQLIIQTYTETFGSDDSIYEKQQLAKLLPPTNLVALCPPAESLTAPREGREATGQQIA